MGKREIRTRHVFHVLPQKTILIYFASENKNELSCKFRRIAASPINDEKNIREKYFYTSSMIY